MTQEGYSVEVVSVLINRPMYVGQQRTADITIRMVTSSGVQLEAELSEQLDDSVGGVDRAIRRALSAIVGDLRALADVAEQMVH